MAGKQMYFGTVKKKPKKEMLNVERLLGSGVAILFVRSSMCATFCGLRIILAAMI